ncbi:hypothetical protein IFM89_015776 [Coptis chinensis]|uniref:Uncharacterized protein n=1 Tax=Coptis chinensis TaxID=261450 RepID=A0A835H6N0_9MAGN|nr:hypothetical protein IFM89_015776 [Coptis chinensis]
MCGRGPFIVTKLDAVNVIMELHGILQQDRGFLKDGILVEGLFWKDVERLIGKYLRRIKKKTSNRKPSLIGHTRGRGTNLISCDAI